MLWQIFSPISKKKIGGDQTNFGGRERMITGIQKALQNVLQGCEFHKKILFCQLSLNWHLCSPFGATTVAELYFTDFGHSPGHS